MLSRFMRAGVVLALTLAASLSASRPGAAFGTFYVDGTIKDSSSGAAIANARVVFGPAIITCATYTDASGDEKIDAGVPDLPGGQWEVISVKSGCADGHRMFSSNGTAVIQSLAMTPGTAQRIDPRAR